MGRPGYVYLLRLEQDPDPLKCVYKVGRTNDLRNRQKLLGVLLPYRVTLVWAIGSEDAADTERFIHKQFAGARMRGEWFALTQDQIKHFVIVGLCTAYGQQIMSDPETFRMVERFVDGRMNYDLLKTIEELMHAGVTDEELSAAIHQVAQQ